MLGVVTAVPVLWIGPWLFSNVLGDTWSRSGLFAQAMAVALACQLLASPLSSTLTVLQRQGLLLALDVMRLTLTTGSMIALSLAGASAISVVWGLSLSSAVTYLAYWYYSDKSIRSHVARELDAPSGVIDHAC